MTNTHHYQLDVLDPDITIAPDNLAIVQTETHPTISGLTAAARRTLIARPVKGPRMTSILVTSPDGRCYPLSYNLGGFDHTLEQIDHIVDELVYDLAATLHWHADQVEMAAVPH